MPWFKVDDGLSSRAETTRIPRAYRCSALGLWALAGSWSAKELTDGHVPAHMLDELSGSPDDASWLITSGYWSEVDDGWQFVKWAGDQPVRVKVLADRAKNAARQSKLTRKNVSNGVTVHVSDGVMRPGFSSDL